MADFAALPQRTGGRRRRAEDVPSASASAPAGKTKPSSRPRRDDASAGSGAALMSSVDASTAPSSAGDLEAEPCLWDSEPASAAEPPRDHWEYLDHTADVLLHAWGDTLAEALGQSALALWAHLVDRAAVRSDPSCAPRVVRAAGKDLLDLLFNFLDACLYSYGESYFLCRRVRVTRLTGPGLGEDVAAAATATDCTGPSGAAGGAMLRIEAQCFGEEFDAIRHRDRQGTEVKAITYSAMQLFLCDGRVLRAGVGLHSDSHGELPAEAVAETAVEAGARRGSVADGCADALALAATASGEAAAGAGSAHFDEGDLERPKGERKGAVDIYVVIDI